MICSAQANRRDDALYLRLDVLCLVQLPPSEHMLACVT